VVEILAGIIVVAICIAGAWALVLFGALLVTSALEFIIWVVTAPWNIYRWWRNRQAEHEAQTRSLDA
jgi:hypothetical protein